MQLAFSAAVLVIGLLLAMVFDVAGDLRIFGWLLVALGVLGLASRVLISRLRAREGQPPRS